MGELCCSIDKWCDLVRRMSATQRNKLKGADLDCMLELPPLKMRTTLLRFMVEKFDMNSCKFSVQGNEGVISVRGVDVQCIYGLKDEGLSIDNILLEEGEDAKNKIPYQYV